MKIPNPNSERPTIMSYPSILAAQVATIVHDKVRRIASSEHARTNTLSNGKPRAIYRAYTLPDIVETLCDMISECADESTSADRLEAIATFATTGETRERAFPRLAPLPSPLGKKVGGRA